MEEMFNVYTRNGEFIGIKSKSFCHSNNPNCYHKPVWIWIYNDNKEILIQKRASNKKIEPNKWDTSCAGHVRFDETSIEGAKREMNEELGIKVDEDKFKFLFEYVFDKAFELAQIYLVKCNLLIDKFTIQPEEVSEIKWVKYEELEKLMYSDKFASAPEDYIKVILNKLKNI